MTGQPAQSPTSTADGASLIGRLLTTPRPGGLNGLNGGSGQTTGAVDASGNPIPASSATAATGVAQPAAAAPTIGGGLAGVASKREQEGIKVYKDRSKYNEWEFVYDITKDQSRAGAGGQQQSQQQQGQQQQQQPAQQAMAPPVIIAPPQ
jgi:hypothetical protein